jgi:hypothetical protein
VGAATGVGASTAAVVGSAEGTGAAAGVGAFVAVAAAQATSAGGWNANWFDDYGADTVPGFKKPRRKRKQAAPQTAQQPAPQVDPQDAAVVAPRGASAADALVAMKASPRRGLLFIEEDDEDAVTALLLVA